MGMNNTNQITEELVNLIIERVNDQIHDLLTIIKADFQSVKDEFCDLSAEVTDTRAQLEEKIYDLEYSVNDMVQDAVEDCIEEVGAFTTLSDKVSDLEDAIEDLKEGNTNED